MLENIKNIIIVVLIYLKFHITHKYIVIKINKLIIFFIMI